MLLQLPLRQRELENAGEAARRKPLYITLFRVLIMSTKDGRPEWRRNCCVVVVFAAAAAARFFHA